MQAVQSPPPTPPAYLPTLNRVRQTTWPQKKQLSNDGAGRQDPALPSIAPPSYSHWSKYTLEHQGLALKLLNAWMGTQSFIAAIFHGGYEFKGLPMRGKMIAGLYEPARYSGLWPGIYKPGSQVRKWAIDTPLLLSCVWDSGNAFLKYAARTQSLGAGAAAAAAELANGLCFNIKFAEPIIYGTMNKTMRFLARMTQSPIFHNLDDFVAKPTPELLQKGIPLAYRITRTIIAGTVALSAIKAIMAANSKWVTPFAAQQLGPALDTFLGKISRKQVLAASADSNPLALTPASGMAPMLSTRHQVHHAFGLPKRRSAAIQTAIPRMCPPVVYAKPNSMWLQ